ncbi:adenine-N(1)--methyltransferase [Metschnikowia bicuspidata var. bicuspidata NRRL YB-4993]|uniref:tRNA (adenine(58)-N(1))-methyltransferase non-catalytic subunit TRM6 n=1 Tax=Metschnikowia bicuspidata var. bicuspidata NRRL YB-4993 TaxID=869754 RepID=A0A1A0HID6_9ASCO|nr:adenine-N(1)--methyltransferase [Metschnikowia bicuspidata var. bicuspidata NRRL YB-4993]OBA23647.1 adenine-N(1)--methyltransferase [Metschnikowia bicuspidata var. bicuspidata NRRL YB-4993]
MDLNKSHLIVVANQHVLLRLPSEALKVVHLKEDGIISLGKFGAFKVSSILGHSFGTTFEIIEDQVAVPVKSLTSVEEVPENEIDEEQLTKDQVTKFFEVSAESNQDIINIGSKIQKLDSKQIDDLKKSGASSDIGQKIIEQIIAGHSAFDKKTLFSQQKYLRRKQQKFLRRFQVEYLGLSQLLQYYIDKDIQRVRDMSEETLGMLLSHANIRPGGNYLLVDDTSGVVAYAMLERMKGEGSILLIHENEHANLAALRHSDYSDEFQKKMIKTLSWLQFAEPENEKIDWEELPQEAIDEMKPTKKLQYHRRLKRAAEINEALDMVTQSNFDAFVSVSSLNMPSFLSLVVPRVGGSRPLVFYSPFKEALLETQHELSRDKRVLAPSIYETKARKYQTIQGRLHPLMTLRGYGGYILSGTRVFPADGHIHAVGKGTRKKPRQETSATPEASTTIPVESAKGKPDAAMEE